MPKILYHASVCKIPIQNIDTQYNKGNRLDFGMGFYLNTSRKNASKFINTAILKHRRISNAPITKGYINIYKYTEVEKLKIKRFIEPNREWLLYVVNNRQYNRDMLLGYDIVIGPIADDSTTLVLTNFIAGTYGNPESESAINIAIQMLETMNLAMQVVLKTDRAIQCLSEHKYEEVRVARRF